MVEKKEQRAHNFEGVRLKRFEVDKLFDEYTYCIPLNLEEHVTAIIAPNGTGKTLCLRMIAGFFKDRWSVFYETVFRSATYTFSDDTIVTVTRSVKPVDREVREPEVSIKVRMTFSNSVTLEWMPNLADPKKPLNFDRYIPFLTRRGVNTWRHDHSGDVLTINEIIENYSDMLPASLITNAYGEKPPLLKSLLDNIDCRLIETQRLLILRDDLQGGDYYGAPRKPRSTLAITRKAQALKDIISGEINAYAALSQSLDRSFPKRVIAHTSELTPEGLTDQLDELDEKRRELMDAGILDAEEDDPVSLPEGPIEAAIARVLHIYADDTRKKLATLSRLLEKIKLFKALIDQRFVTKDVSISRQHGIDVSSKGIPVALDRLSSGEQHQLVLFFELLFEIKRNSLILIDEPELSLHVAWQKKFIGDLLSIIQLNKFDVILATHSPQLIGRWNNLVVELGDVYEGAYNIEEDGKY